MSDLLTEAELNEIFMNSRGFFHLTAINNDGMLELAITTFPLQDNKMNCQWTSACPIQSVGDFGAVFIKLIKDVASKAKEHGDLLKASINA